MFSSCWQKMYKYRYLKGERLEEVLKSYGESDELSNASLVVLENMVSFLSYMLPLLIMINQLLQLQQWFLKCYELFTTLSRSFRT